MKLRLPDLHDLRSHRLVLVLVVFALIAISLVLRKELVPFQNADYAIFASWYDYVNQHGIGSFKVAFSNYNPPYTYSLFLITLLPVAKIVAIKGLMIVFDLFMAACVYLVVSKLRPGRAWPTAAAISSLFVPTVLATGVFWGQFDQLYTGFLLLSLYYLLKSDSKKSWIYFGVAIAIKLQAVFFLPVLIAMCFKRIKLWDAIYGVGIFLVLTFLPLLAGRSLGSILRIYSDQANLFSGSLTLNAPNIYQWIPNSAYSFFEYSGILFTMAIMAFYLAYVLIYKKFDNRSIVLSSVLMMLLVPFLLPLMHERYIFSATVFIFVAAFFYRRLIIPAIVLQLTTLFSYVPFLFLTASPVNFNILALANLAVILAVFYELHQGNDADRSEAVRTPPARPVGLQPSPARRQVKSAAHRGRTV